MSSTVTSDDILKSNLYDANAGQPALLLSAGKAELADLEAMAES